PDVLAVCDGCRGGRIAVRVHHRTLDRTFQLHRPQQLTGAGVQAMPENASAELGVSVVIDVESRQEHAIAPYGDPALTAVRQRSSPHDVLIPRDAPLSGSSGSADAPGAVGAGRLGPVGQESSGRGSRAKQRQESHTEWKPLSDCVASRSTISYARHWPGFIV